MNTQERKWEWEEPERHDRHVVHFAPVHLVSVDVSL